ncbi:MAG: hypothetical protein GY839_19475 [candidate division Zixibacteria bacterium]|nr:hypothetical protein [candidate division Zixibacteria bacterium]
MFKKKNNLTAETAAGFILGYEITDSKFKSVLNLAGKGEKGWKNPIFIKQLISDPSSLILHEKWFYDQTSISKALSYLKSRGVKDAEKLIYIFKESNRFESVDFQKSINADDDVDIILDTMNKCGKQEFKDVIDPLGKTYGEYAHPNNYEFERMNAGIIKALSSKYPQIIPLDDSLRAPVYEYLGTKTFASQQQNANNLKSFIKASYNPLIPIPEFKKRWTPDEFIKIHKSKGANQLREIIYKMRTEENIEQKNIERYIDQSRNVSLSLSPTRNVVYAFAGLGAAALSAVQTIVNPLLYIPTAIIAIITADQLYTTIDDRFSAGKFKWLTVAEQLSQWKAPSEDEN